MSEQSEPELVPPLDKTRQWQLVAAVLGGLLVIALITLVVLAASDDSTPAASGSRAASTRPDALYQAEKDANAAARRAAVEITTYDYTSLDTDFAWAKNGGTPAFQTRYAEVSAPIRTLVLQLKAHAVGTVVDSAARATDADHVTVLLFVDQTITNKTNAERKLDQPRMSISMVRTGGRWLVDDVKINNLTNS